MEDNSTNDLYLNLFKFQPSIAQKRQVEIMEGALKSYIKVGFDKSTFEKVAESAKASRSLVVHYFKSRDDLFEKAMVYVRHSFQMILNAAVKDAGSRALEQLEAYVRATASWEHSSPYHAKCYLLFLFSCIRNKKHRKMNDEWAKVGQERLTALLKQANQAKELNIDDPVKSAREVQIYLTGALLANMSEETGLSEKQFQDACWNGVLNILKN